MLLAFNIGNTNITFGRVCAERAAGVFFAPVL